ncbi:copper resistance D family protein [Paenibacillus sinopodophylli]|uniref:copper resistance D family protein n=1 Tax=Paenibacillus sinopodophylli TaxID=1837342 RepID=UPI00110CFEB3|nr:CopD family protein [Paenibacillus sinopodophylli]
MSIQKFCRNPLTSVRWTSYRSISMLILLLGVFWLLVLAPSQIVAAPLTALEGTSFDPHEQVGHNHTTEGHTDNGITVQEALFFSVRIAYYFAFMFAAGIMLWSIAIPADKKDTQRMLVDRWSLLAMRTLLITALLFVFVHISQLLKGYDDGSPREWMRILTETSTGQSWLAIIVLTLLGFVVLRLQDPLRILWALLLAAAESFNGHVLALPSNSFAIVLDFIHIACSALWAGGLLLLLLFWRADRKEAGRFAERFMRAAWLSILLLSVSGIGMTMLLLPSWRYLIYTSWGIMLLAKVVFVIIIAFTGFLLRRRVKQHKLPSSKLLKLDGLMMLSVLIVASIFTYISPVPNTEPLSHHVMGDNLHYTLNITPNGPGPNRISLKIWLPEQLGAPASVKLTFRSVDHPKAKAIEAILQSDSGDDYLEFPGFTETDYGAKKVELPYRGAWEAELLITDQSDAITRKMIAFRND